MLIPRSETGQLLHHSRIYGRSVEGNALTVWLPKERKPDILVMASIHGDEAETTVVLSDALRSVSPDYLVHAVILCANPDGIMRGTRGNARGVDLNRNLPAANWSTEPVTYKSRDNEPQDIVLGTGSTPGSEPETQALLKLLEEMKPRAVISLHAALACIDDPNASVLGKELAKRTELPLVEDVGYPTPGSFGSWAAEQKLNLITYELEADSPYNLKRRHTPVMIDVLLGKIKLDG